MRNEQREMLAAAGEIEAAAQQLGAAVARYMTAYRVVSRAAHPSENRQLTLDGTVGTTLFSLIVRRLRGLGLDPVLKQARVGGVLDESWLPDLEARIRERAK